MTGEMALITILVWNIHGLPLPFLTGGASPSAVERHIETLDYDVLMAQEVWTKGAYKALKRASWPFHFANRMNRAGLAMTFEGGINGYWEGKFDWRHTSLSRLDFLARKGFQAVESNGVLFINTHLDAGDDMRSKEVRVFQMELIIEMISKHAGPVVLAGDLNLKPSYSHKDRATLFDLTNRTGLTVVLNNGADYVLVRDVGIQQDAKLLDAGPSDHKPMLVTIRVP